MTVDSLRVHSMLFLLLSTHCACADCNLTIQLDQFSSMSNSNVVTQPSMKAANDPRFDLEKYNACASRTIGFLKIHAPDLANSFSIIPSLDVKQRRKFDEFTKPSNAPIQAVNYLRTIANAHMQQLRD
eukprot:3956995-Pleurochrysis_carterae.AAC.1